MPSIKRQRKINPDKLLPPKTYVDGDKVYDLYFVDQQKRFVIYKTHIRFRKEWYYDVWKYQLTEKGTKFQIPYNEDYGITYWPALNAMEVKNLLQRKWKISRLEGIYY